MTPLDRYAVKQQLTEQLTKQANALMDAINSQGKRLGKAVRSGIDDYKWAGRKSSYQKLRASAEKHLDELGRTGRKAGKMGKAEVEALVSKNGPAAAVGGAAGLSVGGGLGALIAGRKNK